MTLKEMKEEIKRICMGCKQCDPCCTGNILKKCIENNRFASTVSNSVVISR